MKFSKSHILQPVTASSPLLARPRSSRGNRLPSQIPPPRGLVDYDPAFYRRPQGSSWPRTTRQILGLDPLPMTKTPPTPRPSACQTPSTLLESHPDTHRATGAKTPSYSSNEVHSGGVPPTPTLAPPCAPAAVVPAHSPGRTVPADSNVPACRTQGISSAYMQAD
jgi:hypothetical protein